MYVDGMEDYGRLVESRKEKEKKWIRDHNRKMKDRERATHATGYKTKKETNSIRFC